MGLDCGCLAFFLGISSTKSESKQGISFQTIVPHLQVEIAKKMNFYNFKEFSLSSKLAYKVAESVTTRTTLEINRIRLTSNCTILDLPSKYTNAKPLYFAWERIKDELNCPRFCITGVIDINGEGNHLDEIIEAAENGEFDGRNCGLIATRCNIPYDEPQFSRFMELFNVKRVILNCEFKEEILRSKQFRELDMISLPQTLQSTDFSAFRASEIDICVSSPFLNDHLNTFFKEWQDNKRDIRLVKIHLDPESNANSLNPDVIFSQNPNSLLWALEHHKSSCISKIPLDSIWKKRTHNRFYGMKRKDSKLWISIAPDQYIHVEKVVDAKLRLEVELDYNFYRRHGRRCLYDHKRNLCTVHGPEWCKCCRCFYNCLE